MLTHLVKFSLRFHGVVLLLACLIVGYGLYVALHAKLDVFPEFVPPQVVIQTEAPGLPPGDVETRVTRPIENAVNGLGHLDALRSQSIEGLSVVTVVFEEGTDILTARQALAERLAELSGALPDGVHPPKMEPLVSSTMDLLKIGLTSTQLSPMELRTFADWTLKPALLNVPGVAKCSVFGGDVREYQIQIDPLRLAAFDLSIRDVAAATRDAIGVRGAGFLDTASQRITVDAQTPDVTVETIGMTTLDHANGKTVRIRDVATVVIAPEPKVGDAVVMATPGVLLTMSSQYGANTMEVTLALERALDTFKGTFQREGITYHPALHRPATFITNSLYNVTHSLILGGILVAVVLLLFLMNLRTAFISLTAIPLSLLAAIIVMDKCGFTLNTITLGGLAIAIGEVVDDAIIDVENIYRRLRENQLADEKRPIFQVVLDASIEVRSAVVYATFVVILVFVPVLTMSGLQGRFFAPLGWAYIIAILASLLTALTLTPALSLLMFKKGITKPHDPALQTWLKRVYKNTLEKVSRHAGLIISSVIILVLITACTLPFFGGEFMPDFREGHFVIQLSGAPGTSLAESRRMGQHISAELLAMKGIKTVEQQIGRSELGEDTWGPEKSEFHVNLDTLTGEQEEQLQLDIKKLFVDKFPGIACEVTTFLGDRISESIVGENASVVVNLFGDDLDQLDAKAAEIASVMGAVPGAAGVEVTAPPGEPRLVIRPNAARLMQFGYKPLEVLEAVQTVTLGQVVAQTYEGSRTADVVVTTIPALRENPEAIADMTITNAAGNRMKLRELADIYMSTGRSMIEHEGAQRRMAIKANPTIDPATFVARAQAAINARVKLPQGFYVQFAGEAQAQRNARNELILHSTIAGAGILILMAIVFGNVRNLLLLLANLPFALVGGVLATILTAETHAWPMLSEAFAGHGFFAGLSTFFSTAWHQPLNIFDGFQVGTLSVGAMVGFVTLFGITTRNSIMMLSHFEHLVKIDSQPWNLATALRGASERLIPILMTALVTAIGLLPLALGSGEAGREIEGPMAIVILGGLATSTLLNLLVMPTLALKFARFK